MSLNNALLPMGFQIQMIWSECTIKKKICPTIQGIVAYPRKNTYWPVKLSMFLVLCKSTSWGSIATASKYSENVHITWPPIHLKNLIRINKWNIVTQVIKIPAFLKKKWKMKNAKQNYKRTSLKVKFSLIRRAKSKQGKTRKKRWKVSWSLLWDLLTMLWCLMYQTIENELPKNISFITVLYRDTKSVNISKYRVAKTRA